jgi:hypothetical protein
LGKLSTLISPEFQLKKAISKVRDNQRKRKADGGAEPEVVEEQAAEEDGDVQDPNEEEADATEHVPTPPKRTRVHSSKR